MIPTHIHGTQYGCNDTGAPEGVTAAALSSVLDALDLLRHAFGDEAANAMFRTLPDNVKLSFNYANWKYVAKERR
jgi:hypothetical protein